MSNLDANLLRLHDRHPKKATPKVESTLGAKDPRRPTTQGFTLVELLVVVAIISVLAGLLMPALHSAVDSARSTGCASNLKQLGLAHVGYQDDWDGKLAHSTNDTPNAHYYMWANKLAPYLGFTAYVKPNKLPGNVYTCPENPEGGFNGNFSSFGVNAYLGAVTVGGIVPIYPAYTISQFKQPSAKVFLIDGWGYRIRIWDFMTGVANPGIRPRHANASRANVVFLDSHVRGYGFPPLPMNPNVASSKKWLLYNEPSPGGL